MKFVARTETSIASTAVLALTVAAARASGIRLNSPMRTAADRAVGAGSRNLQETCDEIILVNSENDGEYVDLGWVSADRPIFFSKDTGDAFVIMFMEENFSTSSMDGSNSGSRRDLIEGVAQSAIAGEHGEKTPWHRREGTREILQSTVSQHLDHSTVKAIRESATTLEACRDGVWFMFPFPLGEESKLFPIYLSLDCADHPLGVSSPWYLLDETNVMMEVPSGGSYVEEEMIMVEGIEDGEDDGLAQMLDMLTPADLEFSCADDEPEVCINLGLSGCDSKEECCDSNDMNASVNCWDERCCNKTGNICVEDDHCCDGLSCMEGLCANPEEGKCVSLGRSGCAGGDDCCSANTLNVNALCNKGRCCNMADGGCENDADCCDTYECDLDTSICVRED